MQEMLKNIGLSDNEIEVYLAVLRLGKISYGGLSKNVELNRTTLYGVAKSLLKKGLIHEDIGSNRKYLMVSDPKELLYPIEREQRLLDQKKVAALNAINEISKVPRKDKHFEPKIKFVEEAHIESFLFKHTDKWNASIKKYDRMWWGFQDATSVKIYNRWLSEWWKQTSSKNIGSRIITNVSEAERMLNNKHPDRVHKYLDNEEEEFSGSMWIAGDYIITIVSKQHPHYLIETHDPIMASNLRGVFKQLWKRS